MCLLPTSELMQYISDSITLSSSFMLFTPKWVVEVQTETQGSYSNA